ncbi:MAG TPA: GNAT family N-acetyltransferase [Acidimicrobiales bacterium]|nr:GNAT family N-acetyltransferase [Acidimicrobiales bacterium]
MICKLSSVQDFNDVVLISSHDQAIVTQCARLMSETDPWHAMGFSEDECLATLTASDIVIHVVWDGGTVSAFLASLARGVVEEPLIRIVCVRRELQGAGLGSHLLDFFESVLFPNAANLFLCVSETNVRAKVLYERRGYLAVGKFSDWIYPNQAEFLMRKTRGPRRKSV